MNGERTLFFVVVEGHAGSVEASFAFDEVTEFSVFDDHFGPEGISGEAEEEVAGVSGDFEDDVGPAGEDLACRFDFMVFEGGFDDVV